MEKITLPAKFPDSAKWIFLDPEKYPDCQHCRISFFAPPVSDRWTAAFFQQEFTLDAPAETTLLIAAECCYRFWIDGRYYGDGPAETGGDYNCNSVLEWAFYDRIPLPELTAGKHTLLIEVDSGHEVQYNYSGGQMGLKCALFCGREVLLTSDRDWLCRRDEAAYGARFYSYHDKDPQIFWHHPAELPEKLFANREYILSELPPPAEKTVRPVKVFAPFEAERLLNADKFIAGSEPLLIAAGEPFTFYFEFPREEAAQLEIDLLCSSGIRLTMTPQEVTGRAPVERDCQEKIVSLPRHIIHRTREIAAVKFVKLELDFGIIGMPGCENIQINSLVAHVRHFPVKSTAFSADYPAYMQLRKSCENTLKMCMQRMHIDSPVHLEGLGCVGDYRFMALQSYHLFGEYRLARQDLRRIARMILHNNGSLFHETFVLIYLLMLRDYILYSGERDILEYPEVSGAKELILKRFAAMKGKEGVLSDAPNFMFVDWVSYRNETMHHPSAANGMAVMTAFYLLALQAAEEIAGFAGDSGKEAACRREKAETAEKFTGLFYAPEKRCFINGIPGISVSKPHDFLPPDDLSQEEPGITPHPSILAAAAGIVPPEVQDSLPEKLLAAAENREIQPYFANYLFEALYRNSAEFNRLSHRMFALYEQLMHSHEDSLRESWFGGDYSHAWSGAPAIWFGKALLGVTPQAPGFAEFLVKPLPGRCRQVSGEVPTPAGNITVKWEINGEKSKLFVRYPEKLNFTADTEFLPECIIETETF